VELRAAEGDSRVISGYAAVYNKRSHNLGGFVEQVDTAAFNKSRGDGWAGVVARFNHDDQFVLGTTAAGTVQLDSDSQGLHYSVDPPQTRQDVVELVQRGDVTKSSFAFRCFEDSWDDQEGVAVRTLGSVQLIDVAPVVSPAYPDASAGLRSLARQMDAGFDEVRSAAEANELLRFFRRTDRPSEPRRMSWAQAQVELKRRSV
jgi:hypothetical protein